MSASVGTSKAELSAETLLSHILWCRASQPRRQRPRPVYGVFDGDELIYWSLGRRHAVRWALAHNWPDGDITPRHLKVRHIGTPKRRVTQ